MRHTTVAPSSDHRRSLAGRLMLGVVLNVLMLVLQIVGGVASHSLGLLSDAAHNGGDVAALGAAYAAERVGRRPPTTRLTYAFGRWEVLVALLNGVALIGVSALILSESIHRLLHPEPVSGLLVMIVALVAVAGNALAARLLHGERSVNARAAFLHLAADTAASGAVVVGGLLISLTRVNEIDPALSIAIGLWIIRGSVKLSVDAGRILLEGVPVGLDLADVKAVVLAIDGIEGIHDLHVWSVSSTDWVASAHLEITDRQVSRAALLVHEAKKALADRFGIEHATLEVECHGQTCADVRCMFAAQRESGSQQNASS